MDPTSPKLPAIDTKWFLAVDGFTTRFVPVPELTAFVPIRTRTALAAVMLPPSPAQMVNVMVFDAVATDACSEPAQLAAVVSSTPSSARSTSSSVREAMENPASNVTVSVSPSERPDGVVKSNA